MILQSKNTEKVSDVNTVCSQQAKTIPAFRIPRTKHPRDKIHIKGISGWHIIYSDGEIEQQIYCKDEKKFEEPKEIERYLLKSDILFDSSENFTFNKREVLEGLKKYYPNLETYVYGPVDNVMLSHAEIPFLIFDRNKGKCYLYISN